MVPEFFELFVNFTNYTQIIPKLFMNYLYNLLKLHNFDINKQLVRCIIYKRTIFELYPTNFRPCQIIHLSLGATNTYIPSHKIRIPNPESIVTFPCYPPTTQILSNLLTNILKSLLSCCRTLDL